MRGMTVFKRRKKTDPGVGEASIEQKPQDEAVPEAPWSIVEIPQSYVRVRAATRILAAVGILVLAGLGIRSIAAPPRQAAAPAPTASTAPIDTSAAVDVARATARDWLNLDSPQARLARLALTWKDPGKAGWSGQGTASVVGEPTVMSVAVRSPRRIDVTVAVAVVAGKADDEKAPRGQLGVRVPIQIANGAASVAGEPAIVGLPRPRVVPVEETFDNDPEMAAATRTSVERFLAAWAAGDTSTAAAPGASIPAPPKGLTSAALVDWRVRDGAGDTRTGKAKVTVKLGAAEITSTYTITFTKVTSGTATRWQVTDIN